MSIKDVFFFSDSEKQECFKLLNNLNDIEKFLSDISIYLDEIGIDNNIIIPAFRTLLINKNIDNVEKLMHNIFDEDYLPRKTSSILKKLGLK